MQVQKFSKTCFRYNCLKPQLFNYFFIISIIFITLYYKGLERQARILHLTQWLQMLVLAQQLAHWQCHRVPMIDKSRIIRLAMIITSYNMTGVVHIIPLLVVLYQDMQICVCMCGMFSGPRYIIFSITWTWPPKSNSPCTCQVWVISRITAAAFLQLGILTYHTVCWYELRLDFLHCVCRGGCLQFFFLPERNHVPRFLSWLFSGHLTF